MWLSRMKVCVLGVIVLHIIFTEKSIIDKGEKLSDIATHASSGNDLQWTVIDILKTLPTILSSEAIPSAQDLEI